MQYTRLLLIPGMKTTPTKSEMRKIYYNQRKLHWNKKKQRKERRDKAVLGSGQSEWNGNGMKCEFEWLTDWRWTLRVGKSVSQSFIHSVCEWVSWWADERASEWVCHSSTSWVPPVGGLGGCLVAGGGAFAPWGEKGRGAEDGAGNLARWRVIHFGQQGSSSRIRSRFRFRFRISIRSGSSGSKKRQKPSRVLTLHFTIDR